MEGFLIRGYGIVSSPGAAGLSQELGFHSVQSGIVPGDHRFRPRSVGVIDTWKAFWSGDGTVSSPGAAGLSQELGFPYRAGRYPGGSLLWSPIRWSRRYMEGFLVR